MYWDISRAAWKIRGLVDVFTSMMEGMVKAAGLKFVNRPERFTPKITKTCNLPDE